MASVAARLLSLMEGAAFLLALRYYPLGHGWPTWLFAALLPAYFLLLCRRPACWLFCLPALLPVLDLAPWTGWFFLEEIDLLLLLTVACGYWRLGALVTVSATVLATVPAARLSPLVRAWLLLCCVAWLAALLRGLLPLPPDDANAWNNYLSHYNSLRLGKAWAWAMLLLPMLLRDASADGLRRHALPGMLAGLAMVALCALWERAVFPGLLNLSSDYRITAPFSAMHTGGAALDGYLALSLPFSALWLARARVRWQGALALLLLALALHAAFTTFSRGLYAAMLAATLLVLCHALAAGRHRPRRRPGLRAALGLLLAGAAAVLLAQLFAVAGYRGLIAAVTLFGASFVLSAQALPWRLAPACVLCALALEGLLAAFWPGAGWLKGPYGLFLLSALLLAGALWPAAHLVASRQARLGVAMLAWTMLACNVTWIGWHRAGTAALRPTALVILLASMMLLNGRLRPPLWRLGRASLSLAGAAAILLLLAIPVSASYYATERFATSAGDLQDRLRHWRQALDMMPSDWASSMFGMGIGSFPATYFWHNPLREVPAGIAYVDEEGNRFLRLASPGYRAGYGELLRLLQRVSIQPATQYTLALDARHSGPMPVLHARLCQRQLLYAQNCVDAPLHLSPPAPGRPWRHVQAHLDSAWLGAGNWLLRAPVQLELAASGGAAWSVIEIDNVSLRAADGKELLVNGQFTQANNDWFFSSDHHHLPWHIKNLPLQLYVESGCCGALAMLGLLILAGGRLLRGSFRGEACDSHCAVAGGAALAGFLVVGLFDSLLDVPRIALLLYLMLLCTLLHPPVPIQPLESAPP